MDPEDPTPSVSGCGVLTGLPEPAMESFLALTGPGSGSSLLMAELAARGQADATGLVDTMSPYSSQRSYLNFTESPVEVSASFPEAAWRRLTALRSAFDEEVSGGGVTRGSRRRRD
jgi:hypothetical protein